MDYGLSDSSGTDDDFPPPHRNRFQRGGRAAAPAGNGRALGAGPSQLPRLHTSMESQIHIIEQEAYSSVLRAFSAQSDTISWEQEGLITELRKELNVSDEEHRELLSRVNGDDGIQRIREWRKAGGGLQSGMVNSQPFRDPLPSPSVSGSRKKQRASQPAASLSLGAPSPRMQPSSSALRRGPPNAKNKKPKTYPPSGPGKVPAPNRGTTGARPGRTRPEAAPFDPLIGRKVWTRWPEDNQFYEAVITDYNPAEGRHALVYDMNTANETWEWVNLKEISPEDIQWENEDPGVSRRGGHPSAVRGAKKFSGRGGAIGGTGRGRGSIKGIPKKDFQFSQNGIGNNVTGDIKILHTEMLIKEVEKVFGSSHPTPTEIDEAAKVLKDQEQALLDAISRLEGASDGESDKGQPAA